MAIVTNQTELLQAIAQSEIHIEIGASFEINQEINLPGTFIIESEASGPVHTLTRQAGFRGPMFTIVSQHVTFGSIILDGNKANNPLSPAAPGQPLISSRSGMLELLGTTIRNAASSINGGGIAALVGTRLGMQNCVIEGCESLGAGGGMYVAHSSTATLREGNIVRNNRAVDGGGIYGAPADISIADGCSITGNSASESGGGIYADAASTLAAGNVTISDNTAGLHGGGIHITGHAIYSTRLALSSNAEVMIRNNTAGGNGGGIYAEGAELTVNLFGVRLFDNRAELGGGAYIGRPEELTISDTIANENIASLSGGGMYINSLGTHSVQRLTMRGNTAAAYGGGLYVAGAGAESFSATHFILGGPGTEGNSARYGGGLAADIPLLVIDHEATAQGNRAELGGSIFLLRGSRLRLAHYIRVIDSIAGADGGGLYISPGAAAELFTDITFMNNLAEARGNDIFNGGELILTNTVVASSGVYLPAAGHIALLPSDISGSNIQLEASPYVDSFPGNSPIVLAEGLGGYLTLNPSDAEAFRKPAPGFEDWTIQLSPDDTQVWLVYAGPDYYGIAYHDLMGAANLNPGYYTAGMLPLTLQNPGPLPGYTFLGWFDAPVGGNRITEIPTGSTGDITLYARWQQTSPPCPVPPCPVPPCPVPPCCRCRCSPCRCNVNTRFLRC